MRRLLHLLFLLLLLPPHSWAQTEDEGAFERFNKGARDVETLAAVLPLLSAPEHRGAIRGALLDPEKAPRADLVSLLSHPMLATRLGALEILEQLGGGDLAYNPWARPTTPENQAALARWQAWAGGPAKPASPDSLFTEDQRRGYLRDILSDDRDKAARSRRMLEAEGFPAVGFLETFLQETPTLSAGHRARVREAQYQITLSRQLGDQAAATATQLAFGSRDQLLSALATVRTAGLLGLPIIRDFIAHPDPLVRETAIDAFISSGGSEAVAIVSPLLKQEPDVNVIHGAMRKLKDIPGQATTDLVASFLSHPDEDLLISAIQTSLSLSGSAEDSRFIGGRKPAGSVSSPADTLVIAVLSDKRWRVRAAALEYVTKRKLSAAEDACITLLEDPDEFVRFAAIKAIGALGASEALPKLKAMFLANEAMAGPVVEGYGALGQDLDKELLAKLDTSSVEARLAALRAVETSPKLASLALHYSSDKDLDVACAALRFIAPHADLIKNNDYASVLASALKSPQREKVEAVLERLNLPPLKRVDPRILQAPSPKASPDGGRTALDPLYDAFLLPGRDSQPKAGPSLPEAQSEIVRELILRLTPETPAEDRFRAALHLIKAGQTQGFPVLIRELPTYTTAQKTTTSEHLYNPSSLEAIPLLQALLRDPIPEVRSEAASSALSTESAKAFVDLVLTELSRPGAVLQPQEVYSYHFESIVRSSSTGAHLRNWAIGVLKSPDTPGPLRILAIISLRGSSSAAGLEALKTQSASPDAGARRAARQALFTIRPAEINPSAEAVARDSEAFVRETLPIALNKGQAKAWQHRFSDLNVVKDSRWSYENKTPKLAEPARGVLIGLAAKDPSALVRFESMFALLSQDVPIDMEKFINLFPQVPKGADASHRVTDWLVENAPRATPGLRPLLAVVDPARIKPEMMEVLQRRIQPSSQGGFATFSSLAKPLEKPHSGELLTAEAAPQAPAGRKSLEVVYFFKPGCPECTHVGQYLIAIGRDFPLIHLREHNILEASGTVFNQALCGRFGVPSAKHNLSPAIFTQAGTLIREEITPQALGKLFADTMAIAQDDAWLAIGEPEKQEAAKSVDRRYAAFTLPVVIGAGLLDGINPCAFATIIFFLSYLQIARRTPREMLLVGIAFISAVFTAYLSAGLILHHSLAVLNARFAGIQKWMNIGFAILALIAALLSFRDAWKARAGRLDEMTLQLPGFLKDRIRGVIRTTSRARNFIIAAFISGFVVSLLELACTGQVYAPIIYQIQQGRLDAVLWLVIYNLAFITPLIVIFLLAYGGLRSESLVAFQKKHTTAVKIGLGLLFLVLAIFIFFGQSWLVR